MNSQIDNELTYKIIGILFETHNKLGNLLQEKYYQRAISHLLNKNNIEFNKEQKVNITIDDHLVGYYKLDFVIKNKLVLETKTVNIDLKKYHYQVLSYMNQLQIPIALLVNFRKPKLQIKRLILPDKYIK